MTLPFRIDPGNDNGIHIVDIDNGGERVFVKYEYLEDLISELIRIKIEKLIGVEL